MAMYYETYRNQSTDLFDEILLERFVQAFEPMILSIVCVCTYMKNKYFILV